MKIHQLLILPLLLILIGCQATTLPDPPADVTIVPEQAITTIPLAGLVSVADAEISGLGWYGDWLILLPQYPSVVGNSLYALSRADIEAYLDGANTAALTPQPIPLIAPDLEDFPNFEGLEAIAFDGDKVYVTVETDQGSEMAGYLFAGEIAPDLSQITLDTSALVAIPPQTGIDNYSEETVLIYDGMVMTLYEANGANINDGPLVHRFDGNLNSLGTLPFPNIEYRITDATMPDENGRFWATNFIFSGSIDKLDPAADPLIAQYGIGQTHTEHETVERLVEFQYTDAGITLTDTTPIQLQLLANGDARNWEGIARLNGRGFLLATDKFPETILGFVATPTDQ